MDFKVDRSVPSGAIFESTLEFWIFLSKATVRIKIYHSNKKFFVEFLDFEQNLFGLFTRSFWAWLLELHLPVHSNVFTKNIFFEKKVFLPNLQSVGGTFSCFCRKNYGRVDKSAFFVSEGPSMENKLFEKLFPAGFIKTFQGLQKKIFTAQNSFQKNHVHFGFMQMFIPEKW